MPSSFSVTVAWVVGGFAVDFAPLIVSTLIIPCATCGAPSEAGREEAHHRVGRRLQLRSS